MERNAYPLTEAAEKLGIGRTLLYDEIKAGRLHPVRIGRRTLLTQAELDRYLLARQAEA